MAPLHGRPALHIHADERRRSLTGIAAQLAGRFGYHGNGTSLVRVESTGHHGLVGNDGDEVIGWIREIVLDSPDPWGLARFWAGLLGGTPVQWYPGWVTLEPPPHGQRLSFQGVTTGEGRARTPRPAPLVHFDVLVGDLAAAHERVIRSGAVFTGEHVSPKPGPAGEVVVWRVYRDPAGHPFCLVTR